MLLTGLLWLCAFTFTPTTLQVPPHPSPSPLLSRLERLEGVLADRQAQWQEEKRFLAEKLYLLLGDVHVLREEKQALQIQTQTLTEENQALKTELGEVHRQLVSMTRTQPSLQDMVTPSGTVPRPGREGDGERREEDEESVLQEKESSPPQHVRTVRADQHGPIDALVNHLAQQVTLLTSELQAMKAQHTADMQAMNSLLTGQVQALNASDSQQRQDLQAAGGSTFVQWGSSTCAGSSELVYSGVLGGSWNGHTGAAANVLCLSLSPKLQSWPVSANYYAKLFGGEYETGDSHQNKDPVCAVCRSPQPTTVMVPGTNVCSAGWTLQYSGFLMAGRYVHPAATQYICVDAKMEGGVGSQDNHDGHVLYFTKTQCGSLPCPPYEDNKLVTCAVCSK